jgi:post-segregation antitoxin (ccd killing protein)
MTRDEEVAVREEVAEPAPAQPSQTEQIGDAREKARMHLYAARRILWHLETELLEASVAFAKVDVSRAVCMPIALKPVRDAIERWQEEVAR